MSVLQERQAQQEQQVPLVQRVHKALQAILEPQVLQDRRASKEM